MARFISRFIGWSRLGKSSSTHDTPLPQSSEPLLQDIEETVSDPYVSDVSHLAIPFVCHNTRICASKDCPTALDFAEWPSRQGWTWTSNTSLDTIAAQMQSWMFFGLMAVAFDEVLEPELFLLQDVQQGSLIDFTFVAAYVVSRTLDKGDLEDYDVRKLRKRFGEKISVCLDSAAAYRQGRSEFLEVAIMFMNDQIIPYLHNIDGEQASCLSSSPLHTVIFACDMLVDLIIGDYFWSAGTEYAQQFGYFDKLLYRDEDTFLGTWLGPEWGFIPSKKRPPRIHLHHLRRCFVAEVTVLSNSIRKKGRCGSLAARLRPSSFAWYRMLSLPAVKTPRPHNSCTRTSCQHMAVDRITYRPLHTANCEGCGLVEIQMDQIVKIIAEDAIPLIKCRRTKSGATEFSMVKGSLNSEYTAISHVWAGGLGNFQNNALPSCQMVALVKTVAGIPSDRLFPRLGPINKYGPWGWTKESFSTLWRSLLRRGDIYLWIDTLCIPVSDKHYRAKAIDTMAQIYAGANQVLVLDPELEELTADAASDPRTLALHIQMSPWMSRSWPMQEGAVSTRVCFKVEDSAMLISEPQQTLLLPVLHSRYFTNKSHEIEPSFARVWNGLRSRSTTEQEDLHAIFAVLLNLSAGEVLALDANDRMKAIIAAQKTLPLTMLYEKNEGSEINPADASWCPAFPRVDATSQYMSEHHGLLRVEDEGFVLEDILKRSLALVVVEALLLDRPFIVAPQGIAERYLVRIDSRLTVEGEKITVPMSKTLLLLTKVCISGSSGYQGSAFSLDDAKNTETRLRLQCTFTWSLVALDLFQEDTVKAYKFTDIYPLGEDQRLVIPADVKGWRKLNWSRLNAFPFDITKDKYEASWGLFPTMIAAVATWGATLLIDVFRADNWPDPKWLSDQVGIGILVMWFLLRPPVLIAEYRDWHRWLARYTQQRWAATLYDSPAARVLLSASTPPIYFTLSSHIPSFIVGIISLIVGIVSETEWMIILFIGITSEPVIRICLGSIALSFDYGSFDSSEYAPVGDPVPLHWKKNLPPGFSSLSKTELTRALIVLGVLAALLLISTTLIFVSMAFSFVNMFLAALIALIVFFHMDWCRRLRHRVTVWLSGRRSEQSPSILPLVRVAS